MALNRYTEAGIGNPVFPANRKMVKVWEVQYGREMRRSRRREHAELFWLEADAIAYRDEIRKDPEHNRYSVDYKKRMEFVDKWDAMTPEQRRDVLAERAARAAEQEAHREQQDALCNARRTEIHTAVHQVLRPDHCTLVTHWAHSNYARTDDVEVLIDLGSKNSVRVEVAFPEERYRFSARGFQHQPATARWTSLGSCEEDEIAAFHQGLGYVLQLVQAINALDGEWPQQWR